VRNRFIVLILSLVVGLTLPALMGPTGGLPSRPNFQAVGVGAAAGAAGTITGGATLNLIATAVQANGVAVARRLSCTTACNVAGMAVGDFATIKKTAATSRASTTTSTADGDLQFTNVPIGEYIISLYLTFGDGAGGSRWRITSPSSDGTMTAAQNCQGVANSVIISANGVDNTCASVTNERAGGSGYTRLTGAGTVSLDWAQNTSNAANTTLDFRSWVRLERVN